MKEADSIMKSDSILDPDIDVWFGEERILSLHRDFSGPSLTLLHQSDLLPKALKFWIRREIASEFLSQDNFNFESHDVDNALKKWSLFHWGHRLETLYLADKANLDLVNCSLLRVKDQFLAFELFQRLHSNEVSFEELSWKYGEGAEKSHGGKFVDVRVENLPKGLHNVLSKLKIAEVSKPHRFGKWFGILILDARTPACFDESVKTLLLNRELDCWLNAAVERLELHLR